MSASVTIAAKFEKPGEHSITRMIRKLQQDPTSPIVNELLARLYQSSTYRVAVRLAGERLAPVAGGRVSGEDIVQDAFIDLLKRTRNGKLAKVDDRTMLFGLFVLITSTRTQKRIIAECARKRAEAATVSLHANTEDNESAHHGPGTLRFSQPRPEEFAIAREVLLKLLNAISEDIKHKYELATALEGLIHNRTYSEIAADISGDTTYSEVRNLVTRLRKITCRIFSDDLRDLEQKFI